MEETYQIILTVVLTGAVTGAVLRRLWGPRALAGAVAVALALAVICYVNAERSAGYDGLGWFVMMLALLIATVSALVAGGLVWLWEQRRGHG